MATDTIKNLFKVDKIENDSARIAFLLKRLIKDSKELKILGVNIDIENVACETNDNLFKKALS